MTPQGKPIFSDLSGYKTEQQAKHTPGPWSYSFESVDPNWAIVTAAGGAIIANVNSETGPDATSVPATRKMPSEANARLIAAAPELLAALKDALPALSYKHGDPLAERVRAAIAKAEGR